ncbi:MAG TPA: YIP1 family protein, partial [Chlamydiales bacterium]|nr:YIP1 family protein [Chlamydiales bacterium]
WGYVIFSIWGWVILWTGKLFKGAGDFKSVRASFAWSNVPMIVSDIIWIITLAVMGASLFTAQQSGAGPSGGANLAQGPAILLLAFALIKVLMSVWSLVICISALAEVQRFSVLKAIGNLILSAIVVGIVIGVLGFAITSFMGNPAQSAASIFFNH